MANQSESKLIQKYHRHINRKRLSKQLKVVYRVAGGMPSERVEEEVQLLGNGEVTVKFRDQLKSPEVQEASAKLAAGETRQILQQLEAAFGSLVPRSGANFVPDSVVGSITVEIEGEAETYYFLVDEEQEEDLRTPMPPDLATAIDHVSQVSKQTLKIEKGESNE